jgi:hypothetical protein
MSKGQIRQGDTVTCQIVIREEKPDRGPHYAYPLLGEG